MSPFPVLGYPAALGALTEPKIANHQSLATDDLWSLPNNLREFQLDAVPTAVRHLHAAGLAEPDNPVVQLARGQIMRFQIRSVFSRPLLQNAIIIAVGLDAKPLLNPKGEVEQVESQER